MADQRSSALFKRAEQLKRWEESDTNRTSAAPRASTKIKFSSGCVFLAACSAGEKEEVLRLLKQGADINTANIDGLTSLHQACIDDNLDMVEFLVSRGADINRGDNEGWTPLHATASCGFLSIAKYLIENGADVAAVNYDGELPVDIAESDQMEQYLQKIIQERGVDTANARAAESRRLVADAERWAETGYCDWRDTGVGGTPLHVAAAKGYIQAARILLERCKVEVDARDVDGWTPLHAAVLWGQREAADLLLRHGADIDAKNFAGQTCFDLVEMNMVSWLEERRAALKLRKLNDSNNQIKRLVDKHQLIEDLPPIKKETPKLPPKVEDAKPTSPPTTPVSPSAKEPPKSSPVLNRPQQLTITTPERRENNWIAPTSPTTPSFRRSLLPPVRDEESETQRKAHAKRVRETRRSTQGVTLDDIKSAEQIARRSNGTLTTGASAVISPALAASAPIAPVGGATATSPTASALACTVTATLTPVLGERRPSWRLHTQDDQQTVSSPTKPAPSSPTAEITINPSPAVPTESPGDKGTEASTQAALNVIQRRRRPKRRFTGIAHLNASSDGDGESVDTGDDEEEPKDYKALWESATAEIDRLKALLANSERQLREAKALVSQNSSSEMEKREKRAMERKLSEMEEELKFQQSLQAENQRLKNENGALIRVISKLSK